MKKPKVNKVQVQVQSSNDPEKWTEAMAEDKVFKGFDGHEYMVVYGFSLPIETARIRRKK